MDINGHMDGFRNGVKKIFQTFTSIHFLTNHSTVVSDYFEVIGIKKKHFKLSGYIELENFKEMRMTDYDFLTSVCKRVTWSLGLTPFHFLLLALLQTLACNRYLRRWEEHTHIHTPESLAH